MLPARTSRLQSDSAVMPPNDFATEWIARSSVIQPLPRSRREPRPDGGRSVDRKSTRLNSSHSQISYAVFCLKKHRHQSKSRNVDSMKHVFTRACTRCLLTWLYYSSTSVMHITNRLLGVPPVNIACSAEDRYS